MPLGYILPILGTIAGIVLGAVSAPMLVGNASTVERTSYQFSLSNRLHGYVRGIDRTGFSVLPKMADTDAPLVRFVTTHETALFGMHVIKDNGVITEVHYKEISLEGLHEDQLVLVFYHPRTDSGILTADVVYVAL